MPPHIHYTNDSTQSPSGGGGPAGWAAAMGLEVDEQFRLILDETIRRGILMCCRQFGKTTAIAVKVAHFAAGHADATVIAAAPSSRQSEELLAKIAWVLRRFVPGGSYSQSRIDLPNGARILALPHQPETIRGFAPQLVVIDEAAYVDDGMWDAIFPMLNTAPGGGYLWLMSTPSQPTGFFHRLWASDSLTWTRVKVTALECSRITSSMLEEARQSMPEVDFAREYLCEFSQAVTAAFEQPMVQACYEPGLRDFFTTPLAYPLPGAPRRARPHAYVGVDLGRSQDPSAIAIVEFVTEPTGTVDGATRAPLFRCSLVLRHLESPRLGTPYTQVVARVRRIAEHQRVAGRCTLVMDASGVGAPVAETLRQDRPAPLVEVVITGGREVSKTTDGYTVPKVVLMSRLEHVLRTKKLRLGAGELAEEFFRQLTLLQRVVKDSGNVTYSTPGSAHDDLVMAVSLAVWRAWEEHAHYLQKDELVPIVGDEGDVT